jgi:hypothetical protein
MKRVAEEELNSLPGLADHDKSAEEEVRKRKRGLWADSEPINPYESSGFLHWKI